MSCPVRLFEIQLGRKHRLEPRLIRVADIRPLPDLDHIKIFEYLEAVAASDQHDDVAGTKHAARAVFLLLCVEIYANLALADE